MNWQAFEQEIKTLSKVIEEHFDFIVGITRGGIVPARLLSGLLNVPRMFCVSVEKQGGERKVMTEILEDLSEKKVLLVEDMLETGQSLLVAKQYLESKGAMVKTACLYRMPISEIEPDYSLRQVKEVQKFPWE